MSRKDLLERITVTSPCQQDWDSMSGNDRVRFCDHCSQQVLNLSQTTRSDALRLVRRSNGRVCIRFHRDPNAQLLARAASKELHQISRRVSQIAAGVFTASISLSSAVVQAYENKTAVAAIAYETQNAATDTPTIVGRVMDQNGAMVPGASVWIATMEGTRFYRTTDDTGEFRFDNLQVGNYFLNIQATGFATLETQLYVAQGELRVDYTLNVSTIEETVEVSGQQPVIMGAAAAVSPDDPFVRAAQDDDLDVLVSLISAQDVNFRDKTSGTTALEHAVENSNREMVQLLLARGADVNARNGAGQTVLMMLSDDATADLVWDLINAGADVNAKDEDGDTPLIEAAGEINLEVLKTLLDAGAKVDQRNKKGQTPLMLAASCGQTNNVRLLLLAGSPLDAVDEDGKNALAYAEEDNHRPVMRLLRGQGAVAIIKPEDQ